MIIDTSAIVAIVFKEPGYQELVEKLADAQYLGIGAATLAETGIVLTARLGSNATSLLARMVQELGAAVIPFGDEHWREALEAYERFGRGRHPAKLNFGGCLSYATARLAGQPLLYKGRDFDRTDLEGA
jgi:ribonuclease VapC